MDEKLSVMKRDGSGEFAAGLYVDHGSWHMLIAEVYNTTAAKSIAHECNYYDELLAAIKEIVAIPRYAYGDNEAACRMVDIATAAIAALRCKNEHHHMA